MTQATTVCPTCCNLTLSVALEEGLHFNNMLALIMAQDTKISGSVYVYCF